MPIILETDDFIVKGHDQPHHSRENGGHVVITPKARFSHRYEMPTDLAAKIMHISMIVGEALTNVMNEEGLQVARINYQDNGNWAYKNSDPQPHLHLHLYVRTANEKHPDSDPRFQGFPDALVFPDRGTGYYEKFQPLTDEDCRAIKSEAIKISRQDKYSNLGLGLE